VIDGIFQAVRGTRAQEHLEMLYDGTRVRKRTRLKNWGIDDLPQPKSGTPGWGSLTLTGLGDAGVTGPDESILLDLEGVVWFADLEILIANSTKFVWQGTGEAASMGAGAI
jgi:hypothetical protein